MNNFYPIYVMKHFFGQYSKQPILALIDVSILVSVIIFIIYSSREHDFLRYLILLPIFPLIDIRREIKEKIDRK